MKLWGSLTTCLMLLSAVRTSPLQQLTAAKRSRRADESPLELPPVRIQVPGTSAGISRAEAGAEDREEPLAGGEKYNMEEPLPDQLEDVVDFIRVTIHRKRRSSAPTAASSTSYSSSTSNPKQNLRNGARQRRERKKDPSHLSSDRRRAGSRGEETRGKVRGGGRGRGQGCLLKEVHLNVSDLGLGYRSSEEMLFRYCSGPCRKSESNYDKILYNLAHNRRFPPKDTPLQACCRPIAFDDDLSFLDDNLVYHTLRKLSARKCGCV